MKSKNMAKNKLLFFTFIGCLLFLVYFFTPFYITDRTDQMWDIHVVYPSGEYYVSEKQVADIKGLLSQIQVRRTIHFNPSNVVEISPYELEIHFLYGEKNTGFIFAICNSGGKIYSSGSDFIQYSVCNPKILYSDLLSILETRGTVPLSSSQ